MNFVQLEFLWFLAAVFTLYWVVGSRVWQNLLLVVASAIFYGWVHPWFLALLYFSAVLDFSMGRAIARWPLRKGWFLGLSVAGNLGMLGFFKYHGFFVDNVKAVVGLLGADLGLETLDILLPVGISFYTFQTLSYTIDVYRGDLKPRKDFLNYLLYVSFFTQLVAGPIERATNLLPQIESPRSFDLERTLSGINLALWGAFKKIVIADTLAPYVDQVFIHRHPEGPLVWAATGAFAIQILADFSGYTDIARGTARMLGFNLVKNFDHPYSSATTPELWRRWHMSLSFWIRDYLLSPLLGNAKKIGWVRFVAATTVAFTLFGFWHGPSWNFVLLGLYNALFVMIYPPIVERLPAWASKLPLGRPLAVVFHTVVFGLPAMLMFRESHLDRLVQHVLQNPFAASRDQWIAAVVLISVTLVFTAPLWIALATEKWVIPKLRGTEWALPFRTSLWAVYGCLIFLFYRTTEQDFIYFQF